VVSIVVDLGGRRSGSSLFAVVVVVVVVVGRCGGGHWSRRMTTTTTPWRHCRFSFARKVPCDGVFDWVGRRGWRRPRMCTFDCSYRTKVWTTILLEVWKEDETISRDEGDVIPSACLCLSLSLSVALTESGGVRVGLLAVSIYITRRSL